MFIISLLKDTKELPALWRSSCVRLENETSGYVVRICAYFYLISTVSEHKNIIV